MLKSNRKETKMSRVLVSQLLSGACVLGALVFGGCDSATAEANKAAQKKANEAVRIADSAGDLRPTEKFMGDMYGKDKDEQAKIKDAAIAAIKADDKNAKEVWRTYFDQRTVAEDLKRGLDRINEAIKTPELTDSGMKSAMHAQIGMTTSSQTQVKLQEMDEKLTRLVQKAIDMQMLSSYLESLGTQAGVLEKRSQFMPPAGESKISVSDATAATAKAQSAVNALQQQITAKEQRALQIYAATDEAMTAADSMPGLAAIEHAKKAVEARKEADNLRAEVLNLQPQLTQAKMDLAVWQIRQSQAVADAEGNATASDRSKAAAKIAADHAAKMRADVQRIMKEEGGLEAMAADFKKMAEELKAQSKDAVESGTAAAAAYKAAQQAWTVQHAEVQKLKPEAPSKREYAMDKLVQLWNDKNGYQFFQLAEATAREQVGRAYLLQVLAERYRGMANLAMAKAQRAAGQNVETPTLPDESELFAQAKGEFTAANQIIDGVVPPGSSADGAGPGRAIKWLGFTLKAVGSHGLYTLSDGKDQEALKMATDAAQKAKELNPFLTLGMSQ